MKRTELKRGSTLNPSSSSLKRNRPISPASKEQREKAKAAPFCIACGSTNNEWRSCDPAHIWPRGRGGCDDSLCVVPLCRFCHRDFDDGRIDLLGRLEPNYREELAHALLHAGLEGLRKQVAPSAYRKGSG